uniref:Uncharacterized protein n=1 Tax=Timema genevievae TaxID=629358 RepID=A0A7R9PIZ8_TIMGE|nr:unnamed protein product [Timema genevievae]
MGFPRRRGGDSHALTIMVSDQQIGQCQPRESDDWGGSFEAEGKELPRKSVRGIIIVARVVASDRPRLLWSFFDVEVKRLDGPPGSTGPPGPGTPIMPSPQDSSNSGGENMYTMMKSVPGGNMPGILTETYCVRLARLVITGERQDSQCVRWRCVDVNKACAS